MTSLRKRHSSPASPQGDDGFSSDAPTGKENPILGFSDDEESRPSNIRDEPRMSNLRVGRSIHSDMPSHALSEGSLGHLSGAESDEMEEDVDVFNKAVHISNLQMVDHSRLLRKMHERFKKKVSKWEAMAYSYARYSFAMNFTILVLQLLQMVLNQAANIWIMNEKELMDGQPRSKSYLNGMGTYRFPSWKNGDGSVSDQMDKQLSGLFHLTMTQQCVQTIYSLITALTALIAGLQLKLKLSEKAERYRKGAKVYGRLLRISSYHIMMIESGGKVDDVSGLWKDAMKKEGKWIPLVRTYVPL